MKTDQDKLEILDRYNAPTKFCSCEFGQIWRHIQDNGKYDLYIQTSMNPLEPIWLRMGEFLERVCENRLEDREFIGECLEILIKK